MNVQLDNQLDDSVGGGNGIHPRARLVTVKRANDRNDGVQQCSSGGWKVSKIASAAAAYFHSVKCAGDVEISDDGEGGREAELS